MKILIASSADSVTGAARAAMRLHRLQLRNHCDSLMLVGSRSEKVWHVLGPNSGFEKVLPHLMPRINAKLMALQHTENQILHSPGIFGSPAFKRIKQQSPDVLNLHWINHDFLSIEQIPKLDMPTVWTLHDSWAFCGAEHHPASLDDQRFIDGYTKENRGANHRGLDIDRMVWNRKRRLWRKPISIVAPSRWLADCVQRSCLMRDWPVSVIPNPLPLDLYKPWDKAMARRILGLPLERPLLLFGAVGGTSSPLKGWAVLQQALLQLSRTTPDIAAVVLGQSSPKQSQDIGMDAFYVGHLFDDVSLALLYSAVDVVVVPSRLENLPQIATEAQSCGVPVVGFNCGGIPDAVEHGETGYLAKPYDAGDLATGVSWVLDKNMPSNSLGIAARRRAELIWDESVILKKYVEVYRSAIEVRR